jgi:putative transposase
VKVFPFIAAEKGTARNVKRTCALFGVSRSAYYDWTKPQPSAHAERDAELATHIKRLHSESRGTYGAPRIHQRLRQEGEHTARKRVARLMASAGLYGRRRRRSKRTTIPDGTELPVTDLLKREFKPRQLRLDQAWVGDITYLRTWEGWAYLATVIDLASRRVVGFAIADHMRTSLVSEALTMALKARRPRAGLIFHSDRGSQYTSQAFRDLLGKHQLRQSLSRPRQCWDNAVAESFFSTLKTEHIYRTPQPTVAAARTGIFEYIEVFYNRRRIHSALGYRSPADYEAAITRGAVPAA